MANRCENCGCGMDGGFCLNCHEEVFIAEQYSELGEDVPLSIAKKVVEHTDNPERKKQAKKIRKADVQRRTRERKEYFGE